MVVGIIATQHVNGLKKMKNASYFQNILLLLKIPAPVRFMIAGMFIRLIAVRSRLWSAEKGGGFLASENKDISYSKIRMYLLGGFEYNFCVFNRLRTFWIYTLLWEQADHILTRICLIDLSINKFLLQINFEPCKYW